MSNQSRILSQQWEELSMWIGNVFSQILEPILPYLNAVMMTLVEIVKLIAKAVGYSEEQGKWVDDPLQISDSTQTGLEDALDTVEKIGKATTGIDELNILKDTSTAGSSITVDPAILSALSDYSLVMDDVNMKARQISNSWLEALGFIKDASGEWVLAEGESRARNIYEWAQKLGEKINEIIVYIENWDAQTTIDHVTKIWDTAVKIWNTVGKIIAELALSGITGLIEIGDALVKIKENGLELGSVLELLRGIGLVILYIGTLLGQPIFVGLGLTIYGISKFLQDINDALEDGKLDITEITTLLLDLGLVIAGLAITTKIKNVLSTLELISGSINKIIGIIAIVSGAILTIKGIAGWIEDENLDLRDMQDILSGISLILSGIGLLTKNWILLAAGGVVALISYLVGLEGENSQLFNELSNLFEKLKETATKVWDRIQPILLKISELIEALLPVITFVIDTVLQVIIVALNTILPIIEWALNVITDGIVYVTGFITGLFGGIIDILKGVIDFIVGIFTGDWEKAWHGIANIFIGILNLGITAFETFINAIIFLVNTVIGAVIGAVRAAANLILGTLETVASWIGWDLNLTIKGNIPQIPMLNITRIPTYAQGGLPSTGELFMAREAGAELIGRVGNRTAVMNNEQIADTIYNTLQPMISDMANAIVASNSRNKTTVVKIDSREIARANTKGSSNLGYNQFGGGAFANV